MVWFCVCVCVFIWFISNWNGRYAIRYTHTDIKKKKWTLLDQFSLSLSIIMLCVCVCECWVPHIYFPSQPLQSRRFIFATREKKNMKRIKPYIYKLNQPSDYAMFYYYCVADTQYNNILFHVFFNIYNNKHKRQWNKNY